MKKKKDVKNESELVQVRGMQVRGMLHGWFSTATVPLERNVDPGWDTNQEPPSRAASVPGSEPYKHS